MARHDQSPKKRDMTCKNCKDNKCHECVDVLRVAYTDIMICTCTRKNHDGEAAAVQVSDPFTGTVYGPHAEISTDGEVEVDPEFKENFVRWLENG